MTAIGLEAGELSALHGGGAEGALLLAAAGDPRDRRTRAAVEDALAAAPDWTRVVQLALAHGMTPALGSAIDTAGPTLVPEDIRAALRQHCDSLRERSVWLIRELYALLDALDSRSVGVVSFKGPLMAEALFGDAGQRPPGDIDLLLHGRDVTAACDLLRELGFTDTALAPGAPPLPPERDAIYRRYQCEYQFARTGDGLIVEPHWDLAQRVLAIDVGYESMLARARVSAPHGRPVRQLAPEDLLLALCVHGAKHHWERLSWVRDVAALAARQDLDLVRAIDAATAVRCRRIVLVGLALAECCAPVTLPPAVQRLVAADATTVALTRHLYASFFDPDRVPPDERIDRVRFRLLDRRRDRARYVARSWLYPRRRHLEMVNLPASLAWAYYPLTWAHEYAALPVWRVVKPMMRPADS